MSKYSKVIFVSNGGTCRSILAKAIFEKFCTNRDIDVLSRGMVVLFKEPANPKAVAVAKAKGVDIENCFSEQLVNEDFDENSLVLAMTDLMKKQVYEKFSDAVNVYSLREYVGEAVDVEAPFGGELSDYAAQFEYLEKLIEKLNCVIKDM